MRARHQTGEGGFTLVEVMVAMLLLAIALTGLAQLAGSQMVASLRTRVRQVATSYVNQELESLRSMTYTRLAMDPSDGTVPATQSGENVVWGTSGCAGTTCLTYSKTVNLTNNQVSGNNFTFTENRWVGSAGGGTYKTVFVTLTSTSGGPSFTYSSQTDVSGATTNNPSAVTAIEIDLQHVDSSGNPVLDSTTGLPLLPPDGFNVTVKDSNNNVVASGTSADGVFGATSGLSPSTTYTCTVSNPGSTGTATWLAYAAADSSFSCSTGTAGTTTSYTSHWKQAGCTATGGTGSMTATVYNSSGSLVTAIPGVAVAFKAVQGQAVPSPNNLQTNTSGVVQYNTVNAGLWTLTLSGGGLSGTKKNMDSVCIWAGQTTDITLFDLSGPPGGSGNNTLTVPVNNTYPDGTATIAVEAVDTTNTYKFETQVDVDGCGSCSATPATNVVVPVFKNFTYNVTINCVGVGGADPPGTPDGPGPPAVQDGETLSTWNPAKITANITDPTTEAVKCPTS